jgi:hypothetical protein
MTMIEPGRGQPPWHIWAVGGLGLLWNAYGCFDYAMSKIQGDIYLRQVGMTASQIAHFNAMPAWMTAVWAIGVWGALLGSVLLLLRRRLAAPVFLVYLLAYVASLFYTYMIAPLAEMNTPAIMIMQVAIFAFGVGFVVYALVQAKAGTLR